MEARTLTRRLAMPAVSTRLPDGSERTVAQLTPGSFFGEMSLLTRAPRGASVVPQLDSVVMEIGKELLEPLMAARPELATVMSEYLAERQTTTVAALERDAGGGRRDRAGELLARIRGFFGLDTKAPAD